MVRLGLVLLVLLCCSPVVVISQTIVQPDYGTCVEQQGVPSFDTHGNYIGCQLQATPGQGTKAKWVGPNPPPDLILVTLTVSPTVTVGQNIGPKINLLVEHIGGESPRGFQVDVYMIVDPANSGKLADLCHVSGTLDRNGHRTYHCSSAIIPKLKPGPYIICARLTSMTGLTPSCARITILGPREKIPTETKN